MGSGGKHRQHNCRGHKRYKGRNCFSHFLMGLYFKLRITT